MGFLLKELRKKPLPMGNRPIVNVSRELKQCCDGERQLSAALTRIR